jgi:hypothetical protein
MLALFRDGRQGAALEAFRRLRRVLADELGVDPGPEARRLEAAILAQDPRLQPREQPPIPVRSRETMSCFGRERELATLLDHLADAAAGRGRVAFVSGEPGIGKSRLLAELAATVAARGAQVLVGRCLEGAGALPFHPFVEAVEAFLGGKPPPEALGHLLHGGRTPAGPVLQPDELRSRLLDGMARFLVGFGAEATVVLVGINSADSHREYPRPRSTPSAPAHSAAARPRPTPPSPCSSIADSRPGPAPGRREGPARYPAGGPVPRRCHGPATSAG